jgi:polysaccharide pyruvyl transferase WcaK-like protein
MEKFDVQHSHAVVAHMRFPERAEILRRRYSSRQILDLMGRFDFAVGMRLHFLIFAALRGTPFISERVPALRSRARQTNEALLRLLPRQ